MNTFIQRAGLAILASLVALPAQAADNIQLGNLRFAHYGAVSYMKEVCPKYGVTVEIGRTHV